MDNTDNQLFEKVNKRTIEIQLIRSEIIRLTMEYFKNKDFLMIDPPIIHECIPNKKSEIYFPIDDNIYALNSSNALYLSAYASLFNRVFSISPTFRKEKASNDHLIEFRMLEVEMTNFSFDQCVELVSDFIKYILFKLSETKIKTEFSERFQKLYDGFQVDFFSYNEIIEKSNLENNKIKYGADLSDYDREVSNIIKNATFIIDYPFPIASWTALPKENNIAYAFNLILPDQYGELAEGCQRNNDYDLFKYKFEKAGIESLDWYLNMIKECNTIRSGFGIGIERLIRWVVGSPNIADTVLFPRSPKKG